MENVKAVRTWFVALLILAVVVGAVALFLWISSPAAAQLSKPPLPAVVVQWRPQSILETMFSARIAKDNRDILAALQALATNRELTGQDMAGKLANTYLRTPQFWTGSGWVEGWEKVLPKLKDVIAEGSLVSITSVSALIEYRAYAGAATPAADIDAVATVRVTFSASPGDNVLEGKLDHSRICDIFP